MRRRRRIKPTGGVQMFSFLDAMICTMGALLVLLHAFARHGEIEIAETHSQVSDAELQAQREELQWRIDLLKQSRDKTEAQLSAERLKLSHVEDHERRLRQRLEQLRIAAQEMDRVNSAVDRDARQSQAELAAAKEAVLDAQKKLKDAREKAQEVEPTYSVVPYEGAHATRRRPVYIECRANSIVLQPEGVEALNAEDFTGFLGPGNALASALRGAREYFASQGATKENAEPYPLLLVRPDGIEAYYAARGALTSWGSDFGYELVGGDWKLKFPDSDPKLAELTQQIVAEARERQAEYVASAPSSRNRNRPKYHARSQGGFSQERGSGGGGGGGGRGGWDSLGSNWGQGKSKRGGVGGEGHGEGDGEFAGAGGSRGSGLGSGGDSTGPGGDAILGEAGAQQGSFDGTGGNSSAMRSDGKRGGAAGGSVDRYGQPIDGSPATGELSPENAPYGTGEGPAGQMAGDGTPSGGKKGARGGKGGSASGQRGQPGEVGTGEASGDESGNLAAASSSSGKSGGRGKSGSASGASGGAKGAAGAQGQGSNADGNQMSAGSGSSSDSSGQPSALGAPPLNMNSPRGKKVKSMAQARGRDWGLPNAEAHAVGATRPLLVECHNDRLLIPADDRSQPPKEIHLSANTQDSMDDLVSNVWKHIEGWGLAGRGMYWKPELVMEVKPGAADRYAEIKGLLADSGLEVRERQPRPATKPAPRKSTRR